MTDRFVAVKAILDNIDKLVDQDSARNAETINSLFEALKKIETLPEDDVGNGLRLAKSIAASALQKYEAQS